MGNWERGDGKGWRGVVGVRVSVGVVSYNEKGGKAKQKRVTSPDPSLLLLGSWN